MTTTKPKYVYNAVEALALLDKGFSLFVTKDYKEGHLRRAGGKPLPVYRRSFLALIHNQVVIQTGLNGDDVVYQLKPEPNRGEKP